MAGSRAFVEGGPNLDTERREESDILVAELFDGVEDDSP